VQLACLLHDASEAYLSDVTRPIKGLMPEYLMFEARLQTEIYEKYLGKLTEAEKAAVSEADDCMLYYEFVTLTGKRLYDTAPALVSSPTFEFIDFKTLEDEFLSAFNSLANQLS
jgi:5'-deoxynucleotidase YfbR-like HD superfamily hydrolase